MNGAPIGPFSIQNPWTQDWMTEACVRAFGYHQVFFWADFVYLGRRVKSDAWLAVVPKQKFSRELPEVTSRAFQVREFTLISRKLLRDLESKPSSLVTKVTKLTQTACCWALARTNAPDLFRTGSEGRKTPWGAPQSCERG